MNFLIAFLSLNVLIIIHELGHFAVAKWSKITVHEFALFMGPKILSITKGETKYSLGILPIGGYVKLEGEDFASKDPRAYNNKPLWVRALVIFAGPFMNIAIAVIILTYLFSSYGFSSNLVGTVLENSPAYEAGIQKGDRIVKYDGDSVLIPNDFYTFMYISKGKPKEVEIQRNGERKIVKIEPLVYPEDRYILGFTPTEPYGEKSMIVKDVTEKGEGKSKLKSGDKLLKFNDVEIKSMNEIIQFLSKNKENKINVLVLRDNKEEILEITPKKIKNREDYETGLYFTSEVGGVIASFNHSIKFTYSTIKNVAYSLLWLSQGNVSPKDMMGPAGMVSEVGKIVEKSPTFEDMILNLLTISSYISIAIGATNLIPIPPLDGSKLLFILIEAIRRKPLSQEKETAIALVGFAFIIILSIFVLFNDVMRILN